MGRTTSSKDEMDRDAAVAASHASTGGVMTLSFEVVVVEGVEAGVVEVEEDLSKLANGMPLFIFSPPFFVTQPSRGK